jgi:hypothetical protein
MPPATELLDKDLVNSRPTVPYSLDVLLAHFPNPHDPVALQAAVIRSGIRQDCCSGRFLHES